MAEKTRYTDEELEEFRQIINDKLALAKRDYDEMMRVLTNQDSNDVDDTSPTYKALEEGSATQTKEPHHGQTDSQGAPACRTSRYVER